MAQRLTPSEPGADLLDEGISRLRAMKTTVGLVLARALEAAHSRFLVFGSTLATLAGKVEELERRDNISWPALEERLDDVDTFTEDFGKQLSSHDARITAVNTHCNELEARVAGIRTPIEQAALLDALAARLAALESTNARANRGVDLYRLGWLHGEAAARGEGT